jgi:hypothetical protein
MPAVRRERSGSLADGVEEGFYWLIWLAVLAGLTIGTVQLLTAEAVR